jgi:hypothetical protein
MENSGQILENKENLVLKANDLQNLRNAGKWASFLAILGFIASGFIAIAFFVTLVVNVFMAFFYLLLGVVYFFISFYLFKFAKFSKSLFFTKSENDLSNSLDFLNKFFSTTGIVTIILLVFYVLAIIGVIVGMMAIPFLNNSL